MDQCQIDRHLPASFQGFDAALMRAQLLAEHTQSMRIATAREVSDDAITEFVTQLAALPVQAA